MKKTSRIISILLSVLLLATLVAPVAVFAAEPVYTVAGDAIFGNWDASANVMTKGADGKYHIKLDEPTSSERPSGGSDGINLTKTSNNISCFFAGWYQERIPVTDNNGNVLDDDGRVLTEENGTYYYTTASGEKMSSSPA